MNTMSLEELQAQNLKQAKIYSRLYAIGKGFNETLEIEELYETATHFVQDELSFEKCLIFQHNDENGWFKVVKSVGYSNPMEQKILSIINLLLSGEVIEYLRTKAEPIIHAEQTPNEIVAKLAKSLFLSEAYFELFGGDVAIPFGLMVTGNGFGDLEKYSRVGMDNMVMLALGNFITQFSNTINNIIFYKAWQREKADLEENILKRTKEINEQKNTFETIFEGSTDGVLVIQNGQFVDCNSSIVNMLRYNTKNEVLNLHPSKLSPPKQPDGRDSFEKANEMMMLCLENGSHNFEWMHTKADGENFWADILLTKMMLNDIESIHVIWRDKTKQKELEKNLIEAKIKAEESTKSKSEFLANMSHEIRTPMNGIIGMSHLALQTNLSDKQKNFIQKIEDSAKSLLSIINDILDFSKIEAGKLTIEKVEFDLFKVIDSVISLVEFRAHEKNLELIVSYATDMAKNFHGDSLRISQILTNLMSNAVKFTSEGEAGIYISRVAQTRFRFEVKDTGIGLTKEQQTRLFQSFSQADGSTTRKYGGTGLGLTISKQLVELMGGKIWLESQIGVGSSFIFEIELQEIENSQKSYQQFSDKKVLIVDDNESWHEILENILEMFGIRAEHAYSAKEAIQKAHECEGSFDLILMDWNMPELDGIEATKMINLMCTTCSKKGFCGTDLPPAVVMVSSFRQESIVKLAKDVGIDIFLQKPINPSMLNDILSGIFLGDIKESYNDFIKENSLKEDMSLLVGSRILLTEDNATNQEIILGLLENSGIIIDIANNGKEAYEKFKANHYDLILMDIQMPIMDGYEATKRIRAIDKEVPIIALTANAMKEDVERTLSAGMNEHLNKPIDVEKLYETLLKYVYKWHNKPLYNSKKILHPESTSSLTLTAHSEVLKTKVEFEIPEFKTINTTHGLKHMAGNRKLYLKILNDFLNNYRDFSFEKLDEKEFQRATHTLKGLSANIGATALHAISEELDETQDKSLLNVWHVELKKVLEELEEKLIHKEKREEKKLELPHAKRGELFSNLISAVARNRPKEFEKIMNEIEKYALEISDNKLLNKVKKHIEKYEFKEASNILKGIQ